jgi:single-stranded DNA-binding protein
MLSNEHLSKGQQVYAESWLKSRTYLTQTGETRFSNDVMVYQVQFLGRPESRGEHRTMLENLKTMLV